MSRTFNNSVLQHKELSQPDLTLYQMYVNQRLTYKPQSTNKFNPHYPTGNNSSFNHLIFNIQGSLKYDQQAKMTT